MTVFCCFFISTLKAESCGGSVVAGGKGDWRYDQGLRRLLHRVGTVVVLGFQCLYVCSVLYEYISYIDD